MSRPALTGRVVVVTGADRPEGAAAARALARAGAAVVCSGADERSLGDLARSLTNDGNRAAFFVGDPADPALVELVAELFATAD